MVATAIASGNVDAQSWHELIAEIFLHATGRIRSATQEQRRIGQIREKARYSDETPSTTLSLALLRYGTDDAEVLWAALGDSPIAIMEDRHQIRWLHRPTNSETTEALPWDTNAQTGVAVLAPSDLLCLLTDGAAALLRDAQIHHDLVSLGQRLSRGDGVAVGLLGIMDRRMQGLHDDRTTVIARVSL